MSAKMMIRPPTEDELIELSKQVWGSYTSAPYLSTEGHPTDLHPTPPTPPLSPELAERIPTPPPSIPQIRSGTYPQGVQLSDPPRQRQSPPPKSTLTEDVVVIAPPSPSALSSDDDAESRYSQHSSPTSPAESQSSRIPFDLLAQIPDLTQKPSPLPSKSFEPPTMIQALPERTLPVVDLPTIASERPTPLPVPDQVTPRLVTQDSRPPPKVVRPLPTPRPLPAPPGSRPVLPTFPPLSERQAPVLETVKESPTPHARPLPSDTSPTSSLRSLQSPQASSTAPDQTKMGIVSESRRPLPTRAVGTISSLHPELVNPYTPTTPRLLTDPETFQGSHYSLLNHPAMRGPPVVPRSIPEIPGPYQPEQQLPDSEYLDDDPPVPYGPSTDRVLERAPSNGSAYSYQDSLYSRASDQATPIYGSGGINHNPYVNPASYTQAAGTSTSLYNGGATTSYNNMSAAGPSNTYNAGPSTPSKNASGAGPSTYYNIVTPTAGPSSQNINPPSRGMSTDSDMYYISYGDHRSGDQHGVHRQPTEVLRALARYNDSPNNNNNNNNGNNSRGSLQSGYANALQQQQQQQHQQQLSDAMEEEEEWDTDDENAFVNFALLSHHAVNLRDKVPRGTHVKGSVPYPRAFTGKDIVSTIQQHIQRDLIENHGVSSSDRWAALQVARSLQSQLFFSEVEWGGQLLQDGVEDVYMFMDDFNAPEDSESRSRPMVDKEELPTGVVTLLTLCYSPNCGDGGRCYSPSCPLLGDPILRHHSRAAEPVPSATRGGWTTLVPPEILKSLPEGEIKRQTIIHKLISKEEEYLQDLDTIHTAFIKPLRLANPPVIPAHQLEEFIEECFGNILQLKECNKRVLDVMYVRQREQAPVIQRIGDVFLEAAMEFREVYPIYVGRYPLAEKRMKEELDANPDFRLFLEKCSRKHATRSGESIRPDLRLLLNRPSEHLQKYPVLLEAILHETDQRNPDADFLTESIKAIKNLQAVAQLRTFQSAMGKGVTAKWQWHDLVSPDDRKAFTKEEAKRQSIIFELIQGEMGYVKDLENIEHMYVRPLRNASPPIIPPERLERFLQDVFHNFAELHAHHRRLVDTLHQIQTEQHPKIRSITAAIMDAALNFREAYLEYIPNYPIASQRIDEEMAVNPAFKAFAEHCTRHPEAHRLDMKNFINRPIPRLLRYELLLKTIMEETPSNHRDKQDIPDVLDVIKALGKESEPGVASAKQKVELWRYNSSLMFKQGEVVDMDLLDEHRSLLHTGKLLRQPDSGIEWNGWSELFVLLFDNYMVMTKPREKDGVMKYQVNRRPIPLDLLSIVSFNDPPTQRGTGLLRNLRGKDSDTTPTNQRPAENPDSRMVYPFTIHHNGRLGGPYVLYAETAQIRAVWKQKLEEALGLRRVVQESTRVFEMETLSCETFMVPANAAAVPPLGWAEGSPFTGRVTCSIPFTTADGRGLVAIGCQEGVWIGFRHDSGSMRRVLHLKAVTQCAMLEEFGIFLVLADKTFYAYHIEALVPTIPQMSAASQVPQKLNKDVQFFTIGTLQGRTLVVYVKKKGLDSVFHVVEPVVDKINEQNKPTGGFAARILRQSKTEWFRSYRDFFLPSEAYDLLFLKARIALLCSKGFEIMDLTDLSSVTIPQRDDPRFASLTKRSDSCKPLGMFRSTDEEFLLCYDEFGLYVNRHGDPTRAVNTVEWEGTAERVALHAPYILLFDTRFIEIRHVETGRLAQIIPGVDVRCVWDGRGLDSTPYTTPGTDVSQDHMVQEARIHAVMNMPPQPTRGVGPPRPIVQHVFELIPTIPLYLPGSLASPSTMTYFPPSSSPPRSPPLRPFM